MDVVVDLYAQHPFWVWLAFAAVLLAIEASTGSGWLLWPAASAGVVALIALTPLNLGFAVEVGIFSALTIVSTILSRKFLRAPNSLPDINDPHQRLVGAKGEAVSPFVEGNGRTFVAGSEWISDLEGGGDLPAGSKVVVTAVNGPRLVVKPA